jgi:hypothetical protein
VGAYEQLEGKDVYSGTPACQSINLDNVTGNQWHYFKNANGLVAAINSNGMNLGTVQLDISDEPGTISYNSAELLGRTMNIRSSLYGTATLPSSYTLRFYYPDEELAQYNIATSGGFAPSDFTLSYREGGSGCSLSTYGGNKAGMVSKAEMSSGEYGHDNYGFYLQASLNHFTIFAASTEEFALPVSLVSFKGTALETHNLVEWETVWETNNAYFEMHRSTDGRSFKLIGERVGGAGDTKNTSYYHFRDNAPAPGTNYYRLKQVDLDGSFTFSHIIAVNNKKALVTLYPNPASRELIIGFGGEFQYRIVNAAAMTVMHGRARDKESLSIEHLPSGAYLLLIDGSAHTFVKK